MLPFLSVDIRASNVRLYMKQRVMLKVLLSLLISVPLTSFAQYTETQIKNAIKQAGGPEPFMQEMVRQTARNLPTKINANVEIQSIAANGKQLMYVTRLVNIEKSSVYDLDALKRSNINFAGCQSPVLGILIREYDAKVSYSVLAKGTEFLFQYDLDRRTCRNK